jgi:hypothetical protein
MMATTKLWPIRGWLGQVVIYVQNPEKVLRPEELGGREMSEEARQGLVDVIDYAMAQEKTVADEGEETMRCFVTGVNCSATNARNQMLAIKRKFGKEYGVVAYHGYQSFKPGEVTPELAHHIGVELAKKLWGDKYQVLVATHLDRSHIHNHFVLNSVSFETGEKFKFTKADYRAMRDTSDALCKDYGLSVIANPQNGKARHHAEWQAERENRPTWRTTIKSDIDECVGKAKTETQFFENLTTLGYEYKQGADISVRPPGKERYFRLERNFGADYSTGGIRARLRGNSHRYNLLPVPKYRHPDFKPPKKLPAFAKGSIAALHRHYLYLLGYYQQRGNPNTNARMHFMLREDIAKLDAYIEDTRLLGREGIESDSQLQAFKAHREQEITGLVSERTGLRAEIRTAAGKGNPNTTKDNPRYQEINARLKKLRKEVMQCERIGQRSRSLPSRIERIECDEDKKLSNEKEVLHGRNRTGDRPDHAAYLHRR